MKKKKIIEMIINALKEVDQTLVPTNHIEKLVLKNVSKVLKKVYKNERD